MRLSRPTALATSVTSLPILSHRSANSLMNAIFVARNALAAYLVSSAFSQPVTTIGMPFRVSGR
jgi:hypothetical protein